METNKYEGNRRAMDIIALRDREKANQSTFRSLWQSCADLMFPQTFGITSTIHPGTELMQHLYDTTGVEESENMASGLVNNLFPAGQQFFSVKAPGRLSQAGDVREYLPYLVEQSHEVLFNSNLHEQVSNTIHYWVVFGMGALYSSWNIKNGLYFRDYAIGTYQCLEDESGAIDTTIITCPKSARQIVQRFGKITNGIIDPNSVGVNVARAMSKPESREEMFDVIQVIRPRENFDPDPKLRPATKAPWESIFVQEKDKVILEESGYDEFPFAIPRYQVIYKETYGRGRGVIMLPQVRFLNRLAKDFMGMSNKWVRPPLAVHDSFDGIVDLTPAALNYVTQMDAIQPISLNSNGVFPTTKDILEYYRESVRQGFFKNAFEPLTPLQGDRRNTTEIIERLKEGMKRLSKPMGRLFVELLSPMIMRSIRLLIKNGVIEPPPDILNGVPVKIEFINPLALALRDQQARGGQYWVSALGEAAQIFPDVVDIVNTDQWARDLGESLGVKTSEIRSEAEVEEIRQQRAEQQQQMEQMAMAQAAAESYNKTTKAPEPGSPLSEE